MKKNMLLIEDDKKDFARYKKSYESLGFNVYPEYHELVKTNGNFKLLYKLICEKIISHDICFLSLDLNLSQIGFNDKTDLSTDQQGLIIIKYMSKSNIYSINTLPIITVSQFSEDDIITTNVIKKNVFAHIRKNSIDPISPENTLPLANCIKQKYVIDLNRVSDIYRANLVSNYLSKYPNEIKKLALIFSIDKINIDSIIVENMIKYKDSLLIENCKLLKKYLNNTSLEEFFSHLENKIKESDNLCLIELIFNEIIKQKKVLYTALTTENGIVPFYQAIVDKKHKIEKYEVLARVIHNDKDEPFIIYNDIASFYGLLSNVTEKIVIESFKKIKNSTEKISINLDYEDLKKEKIEILIDLLKKNGVGVNFCNVTLEILEGAKQDQYIKSSIQKLKKLGFKIAIDDFGIKNSNFERLKELLDDNLIDILKIDGKFIKDICNKNEISRIIVKSIIAFAKKIKLDVVVEHVSCEEIFDLCQGIDNKLEEHIESDKKLMFQGYYFSEPKNDFISDEQRDEFMVKNKFSK